MQNQTKPGAPGSAPRPDALGVAVGPNHVPAGSVAPDAPQPGGKLGFEPDGTWHQDAAPQPGSNLPQTIGHAELARRGERYGQNWGAREQKP